MHQGYSQYKTTKALTASPTDLVVMLYEVAVNQLRRSAVAMDNRDMQMAHNSLIKAQQALEELQFGVDRSRGEIAESLFSIYCWMIDELVVANVHKDVTRVRRVIPMLEELLDAWRTISAQPVEAVRTKSA